MKMPAIKGDAQQLAILGLVGLVALVYIVHQAKQLGKTAIDAGTAVANTAWNSDPNSQGNANAGTVYAGTGPVGTLGHAVNVVLLGIPNWLGETIGGAVADVTMPYNPNATPLTQAQIANQAQGVTRDQAVVPNYIGGT